jgi:hypothetical protein
MLVLTEEQREKIYERRRWRRQTGSSVPVFLKNAEMQRRRGRRGEDKETIEPCAARAG